MERAQEGGGQLLLLIPATTEGFCCKATGSSQPSAAESFGYRVKTCSTRTRGDRLQLCRLYSGKPFLEELENLTRPPRPVFVREICTLCISCRSVPAGKICPRLAAFILLCSRSRRPLFVPFRQYIFVTHPQRCRPFVSRTAPGTREGGGGKGGGGARRGRAGRRPLASRRGPARRGGHVTGAVS